MPTATLTSGALSGADGITLTLQTGFPTALDAKGGGIGYEGFPSSLGVEYDTWANWNRGVWNSNHIAVNTNGRLNGRWNNQKKGSAPMNNGSTWYSYIDYAPVSYPYFCACWPEGCTQEYAPEKHPAKGRYNGIDLGYLNKHT